MSADDDDDVKQEVCRVCGAADSYSEYKCTKCGASLLPWTLQKCTNTECGNAFAITEPKCPFCQTSRKVGLLGNSLKLYLTVTHPLFKHRVAQTSFIEQVLIYLGVISGILLAHLVRGQQYQAQGKIDFFVACFIGFIALPSVFQDDYFSSDAPPIAKFGMAIQRGVFSDLVLAAVEKRFS